MSGPFRGPQYKDVDKTIEITFPRNRDREEMLDSRLSWAKDVKPVECLSHQRLASPVLPHVA